MKKVRHRILRYSNRTSIAICDVSARDDTCHGCDRLILCYRNLDGHWRCPKCTLQNARLIAMKRDLEFHGKVKQIRYSISKESLKEMRDLFLRLRARETARRTDPLQRLHYGEATPVMRSMAAGYHKALKLLSQ